MNYKRYTATVEIDEEAAILFGTLAGIRDVITFQGRSVPEFVQAFHDSVDDYLDWCSGRGEEPHVPQDMVTLAS